MDVLEVEETEATVSANESMTKAESDPPEGGKAAKPLPRGPMLALSVMCVSVALSETVLFPFAAFMVASFHVTDDPAKLGYYAGYLASAFYGGGLLTSTIWGALSDKVGRKPVLILGIAANAVCAVGFGFSRSFTMAITMRFINGVFNGIMPVGRTVVSELCDASNQAKGFALIGVNWGIGFLIGPALGGLLSEPSRKHPGAFPRGSLFDAFAYAPPCLLLGLLSTFGLLCVVFFLPETRGRAKAAPRVVCAEIAAARPAIDGSDATDPESGRGGGRGRQRPATSTCSPRSAGGRRLSFSVPETDALLQPLLSRQGPQTSSALGGASEGGLGEDPGLPSPSPSPEPEPPLLSQRKERARGKGKGEGKGREEEEGPREAQGEAQKGRVPGGTPGEEDLGSVRAFLVRETLICALIYSMLGLATGSQNEVFPLWGMTDPELGGLGFGTDYIGMAQASSGIALVPFQLFLYSPIANRLGPLKTLKIMLTAMAVLTAFPVALIFDDPKVRLVFCMMFFMVRGVSVICAFTSVVICLTNSISYPQHLGAIHGLCQTLNMVFEAAAPTLGASIYAWSISGQHLFPFDYHLYWITWGLLCVFMLFLASLLPKNIDERKFVTEDALFQCVNGIIRQLVLV